VHELTEKRFDLRHKAKQNKNAIQKLGPYRLAESYCCKYAACSLCNAYCKLLLQSYVQ